MRKLPVSALKPGMKLAKDVHIADGRLLLLAGFVVKPLYIEKLLAFEIPFVYVEEDEIQPVEDIYGRKVYSEAFDTMKSVLTSLREGNDIDVVSVKQTVNDIVHTVINNETVLMQLTGIRDIDNYTFLHSVDVCIYSLIIGKKLGLLQEQLTDLGIGAILHDIGKCRIPLDILTKPDALTENEFNIMKFHTSYGQEIINNTAGLNGCIANIAFQHHEKWDGTGYPIRLRGEQIDKFSRIVTISDIYDALTANRIYKKGALPHEAAEYIIGNSSTLVDPEIAKTFIRNISIYPENTVVQLNTGEIGSVVASDGNPTLRPKISIISRKEGPPIFEPYIVDLLKNPSVFIVNILS